MKLSEALQLCIDKAYYSREYSLQSSNFMCVALRKLQLAGFISSAECWNFKDSIAEKIDHSCTLSSYLLANNPAYKWRFRRYGASAKCVFKFHLDFYHAWIEELKKEGK